MMIHLTIRGTAVGETLKHLTLRAETALEDERLEALQKCPGGTTLIHLEFIGCVWVHVKSAPVPTG